MRNQFEGTNKNDCKARLCTKKDKVVVAENQKVFARYNRTKPASNVDRKNQTTHVKFLKGFDLEAFEQYQKEIFHNHNVKKITLKCFDSRLSKEKKLQRGYDKLLKHHEWRCNPQNWRLLRDSVEKMFKTDFPTNPQKKLGILNDFNLEGVLKQIAVLQKFQSANFDGNVRSHKIVLPTSYVKTVASAPKVKLCEIENKKLNQRIELVAMSVDGEILVGQLCVTKRMDYANGVDEDSCSGAVFSIFYQGDPSIVVDICEDHYRQVSVHKNKVSAGFHFLENGRIEPKTKGSHRHWYDNLQIAFPQVCASVNVDPMPINQNDKIQEQFYNSFDDMLLDTKKSLNFGDKTIPEYKLFVSKKQKKLIANYVLDVKSPYGTVLCNKEIDECIQQYLDEEKEKKIHFDEIQDDLTGTIFDPNFNPPFDQNNTASWQEKEI